MRFGERCGFKGVEEARENRTLRSQKSMVRYQGLGLEPGTRVHAVSVTVRFCGTSGHAVWRHSIGYGIGSGTGPG